MPVAKHKVNGGHARKRPLEAQVHRSLCEAQPAPTRLSVLYNGGPEAVVRACCGETYNPLRCESQDFRDDVGWIGLPHHLKVCLTCGVNPENRRRWKGSFRVEIEILLIPWATKGASKCRHHGLRC